MDQEISDNSLIDGNNPGTIKSILQDNYVSGASFPQLFFWNRVLFATSLLLCVLQCLVSGLLLNHGFPDDWPGNDLKMFDLWFPELFGGLLGLAVMFYCRRILIQAKESAIRTKNSETKNFQKFVFWSGANFVSKKNLLWILIFPTTISFALFVVSTVSLAVSVSVVRELETNNERDSGPALPGPAPSGNAFADPAFSGHALSVVLLCLHFFLIFCKIFVLVLGIVIPFVILVISNCTNWSFFFKRIYPFAVFLDGNRDEKPLLIEL